MAGLGQSAVERHIILLEAEEAVQVGLRALQGLPERLSILLRVVDGSQTGAAAVVDMPILQQLIQIDGPHGHQVFQGLFHGFQGDAPDHRAAGAAHGGFDQSLLLEHPQRFPHHRAAALEHLRQLLGRVVRGSGHIEPDVDGRGNMGRVIAQRRSHVHDGHASYLALHEVGIDDLVSLHCNTFQIRIGHDGTAIRAFFPASYQ